MVDHFEMCVILLWTTSLYIILVQFSWGGYIVVFKVCSNMSPLSKDSNETRFSKF